MKRPCGDVKADTRCAQCGGWGWVVLSGAAWRETSADESTWCSCPEPLLPNQCTHRPCELPDGHDGYHRARGETDGMRWVDEWSRT